MLVKGAIGVNKLIPPKSLVTYVTYNQLFFTELSSFSAIHPSMLWYMPSPGVSELIHPNSSHRTCYRTWSITGLGHGEVCYRVSLRMKMTVLPSLRLQWNYTIQWPRCPAGMWHQSNLRYADRSDIRTVLLTQWGRDKMAAIFADNIFICIFFKNFKISHKISLKYVPYDLIDNKPSSVQIMGCRQTGDKPLSESMMV